MTTQHTTGDVSGARLRRLAWQTMLGLFLLATLAEMTLRQPDIQVQLPPPSRASGSRELDRKLQLFDAFLAQQDDDFHCIFLGNSTVVRGIQPAIVNQVFAQETDHALPCFNFGIRGLDPAGVAVLGPALAAQSNLDLIIYGTLTRDVVTDYPLAETLRHGAWYQQQQTFSLKGWLTAQSTTFRYLLFWGEWLKPQPGGSLGSNEANFTTNGYMTTIPPLPATAPPALRDRFTSFEADRPAWRGKFQTLLDLTDESGDRPVRVIVVEMPPPVIPGIPQADVYHRTFVTDLTTMTSAAGVPLITLSPAPQLSDADWADYGHLSPVGAERFSRWLARRLAGVQRETPFLTTE